MADTHHIQSWLNGDLLRSKRLRAQYPLIGLIAGLIFLYILLGYQSARQQHRLTNTKKEMLTDALGTENPPRGMALMMRGRHMCKESRGVRKSGVMTSTYLTGSFRTNPQTRNEFLSYIDKSGNV